MRAGSKAWPGRERWVGCLPPRKKGVRLWRDVSTSSFLQSLPITLPLAEDVIMLKILRWEDHRGLSNQALNTITSGEEEGTGRSDTQHREERKQCGERGPTHMYHTGTQTYHRHTHTHTGWWWCLLTQPPRELHEVTSAPGLVEVLAHHHCPVTASYFLQWGKATSQSKTQTSGRNLDEFPRATLADDHKRVGLKQPKFIISQLWRSKAYSGGKGGCLSRAVLLLEAPGENRFLVLSSF